MYQKKYYDKTSANNTFSTHYVFPTKIITALYKFNETREFH